MYSQEILREPSATRGVTVRKKGDRLSPIPRVRLRVPLYSSAKSARLEPPRRSKGARQADHAPLSGARKPRTHWARDWRRQGLRTPGRRAAVPPLLLSQQRASTRVLRQNRVLGQSLSRHQYSRTGIGANFWRKWPQIGFETTSRETSKRGGSRHRWLHPGKDAMSVLDQEFLAVLAALWASLPKGAPSLTAPIRPPRQKPIRKGKSNAAGL